MTKANNFSSSEERNIREVGRKIEQARLAMRLSIREAAGRTVTSRRTGHLTEFTWRRVERATIQTGLGEIVYRPSAESLMAIAEVVGLDGAALCKKVGLVPPPARVRHASPPAGELEELKSLARELFERLERLEGRR